MKNYKPGSLFRSERGFHFCEVIDGIIKNNVTWPDRILVSPGDHLLFIQHHDLISKTAAVISKTAPGGCRPADWFGTVLAGKSRRVGKEWKEVRKEWEKNKKIAGGIFLTPNGKTIWASHYVMEYFEKKP